MSEKGLYKMWLRWLAAFCLLGLPAQAQQRFAMQEVDEIGHLGCDLGGRVERTTADLGLAKAVSEDCGPLRLDGADDAGKPWTAHMKRVGGVGWTRVFTADFDANGRRDLLFVQWSMLNGRCIDKMSVTAFLFDDQGRPIPWRVETYGLGDYDGELITLLDEDGDGKAEIATSDCEYSMEVNLGVNRRLTGVFEAGDARWQPFRPPSLGPYLTRFQQQHPDDGDRTIWLPPADPWPDPAAGWDGEERRLEALSGTGRDAVLRFRDGVLSPIADGVVIDGPGGREILLTETGPSYDQALATGAAIRLLGDGERPALLWARVVPSDAPALLKAWMKLSEIETASLRVKEGNAAPVDPGAASKRRVSASVFDPNSGASQRAALISRNGRCYDISRNVFATGIVSALPDCDALGAQQSEAAQGHRVQVGGLGGAIWILSTEEQSFKTGRWRIPGAVMDFSAVKIAPLKNEPADLVSVIERGHGFLAQWRLGAQTWLTVHDESGGPISPAIDPPREGELFVRDENSGKTCFLRWEGDTPVELTCGRAQIELVRGP